MPRLQARLALGFLLCGAPAFAQTASDSTGAARLGSLGGELWIGYSPASTADAGVLGRHGGISLGLAGLRMNRRIRGSDSRQVFYTADFVVARVTPLIEYSGNPMWQCVPPKFDCLRTTDEAYGAGITPLGMTWVFRAGRSLQWRLGGNGGAIRFNRRTPSDRATQFNFTAAIEAGMQLVGSDGTGFLIVYRLHHLSNAGTGDDNLAMLSHVISIGTRWRTVEKRQ
jgi:hypothetical protein